ncbi:MAG: hypothetical protein BA863_09695 [Desulfovibrio sp. S3730MH75]|nr:MAG: hypothetical protein BA863_09695 [Desulfovibrio sp. S3730MH75]
MAVFFTESGHFWFLGQVVFGNHIKRLAAVWRESAILPNGVRTDEIKDFSLFLPMFFLHSLWVIQSFNTLFKFCGPPYQSVRFRCCTGCFGLQASLEYRNFSMLETVQMSLSYYNLQVLIQAPLPPCTPSATIFK